MKRRRQVEENGSLSLHREILQTSLAIWLCPAARRCPRVSYGAREAVYMITKGRRAATARRIYFVDDIAINF